MFLCRHWPHNNDLPPSHQAGSQFCGLQRGQRDAAVHPSGAGVQWQVIASVAQQPGLRQPALICLPHVHTLPPRRSALRLLLFLAPSWQQAPSSASHQLYHQHGLKPGSGLSSSQPAPSRYPRKLRPADWNCACCGSRGLLMCSCLCRVQEVPVQSGVRWQVDAAVLRLHARRVTTLEFHPTLDHIVLSGDKKGQVTSQGSESISMLACSCYAASPKQQAGSHNQQVAAIALAGRVREFKPNRCGVALPQPTAGCSQDLRNLAQPFS